MKIYVDADGFPKAVKEILIRAAIRHQVSVVFVANKPFRHEQSSLFTYVLVPEGPDIADDRIAELAESGDLVITGDIPLADRVVSKGACALDPRGKLYTEANVKNCLAVRNLLSSLRDEGMPAGGPPAFGKKDCLAFADKLDSFLVRQLKGKK
ncbi:MAG: YaiI/YqxD family protein [Candidatus Wallbacteria bacterium]|nr:YaiI/YqxD family protein [Candidatus Wallbacteria bacterium]